MSNLQPKVQTWLKKQVPTASDLIFEEFRKSFPFGGDVFVFPEGGHMNIKCSDQHSVVRNLHKAQALISKRNFPLSVQGFSSYRNHIIHLTYKN